MTKTHPGTVENFTKLSKSGFLQWIDISPCYSRFRNSGWLPLTELAAGGPGYKIPCELDGENQYHDRGVLSMAHAGRNTGGSQFFICHSRRNTSHLDRKHTCFGKVYEGLEVIDAIRQGDLIEKIVIIEE